MARIDLIRDAQRPMMNARALFQGPQGSGKTWTMLSAARELTKGTQGRVLMIDTERESALTYADVFSFQHLPWQPPYSPEELTQTLDQLDRTWVQGSDDVVCIDSLSHFWQGTGGILDIANGRVQGGWDKARPMQNDLVNQLLAMGCHLLLGARMKNSVLVSDNGKTIENVGLTVIQDDTLGYELNIVVQMDMQHNATVMKSRTPAVPVGRVYPGGYEAKLAGDYAEWLAGGVPPANREDVERIVAMFGGISDKAKRTEIKGQFVEEFGMPHSLTAEQVPAAIGWLEANGVPIGEGPAASPQQPQAATDAPEGTDTPEAPAEPAAGNTASDAAEPGGDVPAEPEFHDDNTPSQADVDALIEHLQGQTNDQLQAELAKRQLPTSGNKDALSQRLGEALLAEGWTAPQQALA
jgi:hypothetical protein